MGGVGHRAATVGRGESMISLEEARAQILARIVPLGPVTVPLEEALDRTLASGIRSRDAIPPFDNTAMDGFAVRSADLAGASKAHPTPLPVVELIEAGRPASRALAAGEAMRILTGAPIPDGADAIVPFERCLSYDDGSVTFGAPVAPGTHIRRAGEDFAVGDEVLSAGTRLGPAALGVLATVGCAHVPVRGRPRVAVHSSGDELVPVESTLTPGKIRNSNLYSLVARLRRWGAVPIPRPVLRDDCEAIRRGLRATLEFGPDAIITTGGISAGDLDYIREVARELGDEVQVRQVDMKPGKPLVDGMIGGVPFFGLPGNPAACLVSFEIFVRPALAKMEGRLDGLLPHRRARVLAGRVFPRVGRLQLLRGRVEYDESRQELVLSPLGGQGSHLLSSFANANCLVRVGAEVDRLNEGDLADVLLLDTP